MNKQILLGNPASVASNNLESIVLTLRNPILFVMTMQSNMPKQGIHQLVDSVSLILVSIVKAKMLISKFRNWPIIMVRLLSKTA